MEYKPYKIQSLTFPVDDTFIVTAAPVETPISPYKPGQYCEIRLPRQSNEEPHYFSFVSIPGSDTLEFCIRIYGEWTKNFSQLKAGDEIFLSEPKGTFFWEPAITNVAFLVGGIGVAPVISILKSALENKIKLKGTFLYGNRTPEVIMYKDELEKIIKEMPDIKVVHIFSHLPDGHPWQGYRGFITEEIIQKEVDLSSEPTFFIVGPPIFVTKMTSLLEELKVPKSNIKFEQT